jgi:hypothetical protein
MLLGEAYGEETETITPTPRFVRWSIRAEPGLFIRSRTGDWRLPCVNMALSASAGRYETLRSA